MPDQIVKKAKRTRPGVKVDNDARDMYLLTLPPYEQSIKEIALKYGLHEVTVSKKISAVRDLLAPVYEAVKKSQSQPHAQQQTQSVSVSTPNYGGGDTSIPVSLVPVLDTNPFMGLATFAQTMTPAMQAGMVVGSAIAMGMESFNDKHPREKQAEFAGKAGAAGMGFAWSIFMALKDLNAKNAENEQNNSMGGNQ